ncbi:hypothetical protein J2X69_000375 [Algoriphagus sp. 4150]|uniref:hypothetical protein n=1 Tax=Algoriphagus sp. 4150 TaxID=2817756 RepID=UPI0028600E01|nr:hypothetical protein [Algoriphagus sp. 4150]MDR7128047.1 hypothetical protein [Algoriphagus sp. 4150]
MEIKNFDPIKFFVSKRAPYLLVLSTLFLYGFPFKFPHNTFNWIQKFGLPPYLYPFFIVLFIVSFILMIVSFLAEPKFTSTFFDFEEERVHHRGTVYMLDEMLHYSLEDKNKVSVDIQTVWTFTMEFTGERLVLNLLLTYKEKAEFEDCLKKMSLKKEA